MEEKVRLGFRMHTGWAMLVAVAAEGAGLRVLHRERLELLPPGHGRFVYHEAAEMPPADAAERIEVTRQLAQAGALSAIRSALRGMKALGACIPAGSVPAVELAEILRSHPRIHTAEGALYAGAIGFACQELGIPVIRLREREVWQRAAASAGMTEAKLKAAIDALRKTLGAPWTADHKIATAAAIIRPISGGDAS